MKILTKDELVMSKKVNVLIIEDDFNIRDWFKKRLYKTKGADNLIFANDYFEALDALKTQTSEIVILDLSLPGGNGINLLKKIRAEKRNFTVYVFSVNSELKNACLRMGADEFFDKTTESEQLIEAIENFELK